jgi:hypothetical protein
VWIDPIHQVFHKDLAHIDGVSGQSPMLCTPQNQEFTNFSEDKKNIFA